MGEATDDYDIDDWKRELAGMIQSAHDLGLCPLEISLALSEATEELDNNIWISRGAHCPADPA